MERYTTEHRSNKKLKVLYFTCIIPNLNTILFPFPFPLKPKGACKTHSTQLSNWLYGKNRNAESKGFYSLSNYHPMSHHFIMLAKKIVDSFFLN